MFFHNVAGDFSRSRASQRKRRWHAASSHGAADPIWRGSREAASGAGNTTAKHFEEKLFVPLRHLLPTVNRTSPLAGAPAQFRAPGRISQDRRQLSRQIVFVGLISYATVADRFSIFRGVQKEHGFLRCHGLNQCRVYSPNLTSEDVRAGILQKLPVALAVHGPCENHAA